MGQYKYPFGVVWLSHSSITDFEKCPRLYFLHNVYKEVPSAKKIQVVNRYLTLGMVVHDTLERIRYLPQSVRFAVSLMDIFEEVWSQNLGKKGGFLSNDQEKEFKDRGIAMVKRVQEYPGPIANLSTIIKKKHEMVASMWLSKEDDLVLCGNVDWVEVLPNGSLHIIDFKTGKSEEDADSLQLQIYLLLAKSGNKRAVTKLSYWYLNKDDAPKEITLPDLEGVMEILIEKGKRIKAARQQLGRELMKCPSNGCRYCLEYEKVLRGEAEQVGYDEKRDRILYLIN